MSNVERNPNCPMRTSLGNCDAGGGFCTSVKSEVCNALHNAYQVAFLNGQKFERERWKGEPMSDLINRQQTIDALEEQLDYLFMLNKKDNPTAESKWQGVNWARNTIAELPSAEPKVEGWIPCEERLPNETKARYLICTDDGYMCMCRWTNVNIFWTNIPTDWHWNLYDVPQYSKVVAWMPIKPYKMERSE